MLFLSILLICAHWTSAWSTEVIHVVDSDYPPFTYQKDGLASGFSIELLQAVVKRTPGIELQIEYFPFKRAMAISASERNALITSLSRSEERNKVYQWVGPIYAVTTNLYRLANRPELQITALAEIAGRSIGTGSGFKIIEDLVQAGIARTTIEDLSPEGLNISKLFARRVDYVAFNDWILSYLLIQAGHSYRDVHLVLALDAPSKPARTGTTEDDSNAAYYAIQRDTDPAVAMRLQEALDAMKSDGSYAALLQRYFQ